MKVSSRVLASLSVAATLCAAPAMGQAPTSPGDPVASERAAGAGGGAAPRAAPAIQTPPRAPNATVYSSSFDADNGGLTGSVDWEWGAVYAWAGTNCTGTFVQPAAAHSGTGMWGTVLNGCYHNLGNHQGGTCNNTTPADDSILTLSVDLTGYSAATLSFWEWYDVFTSFDWAEVRVNGVQAFPHCEASYVAPTAWVQQNVDLTPYVGGPVTIEWHLLASAVVEKAGWYVDDVLVDATPVPVELQSFSAE